MFNLFTGEKIEVQEEKKEKVKSNIPSLFDWVNSINNKEIDYRFDNKSGKVDPYMKSYDIFMVNKALSQNKNLLKYVNITNRLTKLTKEAHYLFLFNLVPKNRQFEKWTKSSIDDDIKAISIKYNVSLDKAKDIKKVLTDDELEYILKKDVGGLK